MDVERKLAELGLELPPPAGPAARYRPWVLAGNLLFVSGQLPMRDGNVAYTGRVGTELTTDEGYEAARLCALGVLAQIKDALGGFDRVEVVARVDGHVSSASGFYGQPRVLDGASDLLREVLEDRGGHARVALGHNELPRGAAVEVSAIIVVKAS